MLAELSLIISILILIISGVQLYLSHIVERRSEVEFSVQESSGEPTFSRGNNLLDESARWLGVIESKLANTGEKGAFVSSVSYELVGLMDSEKVVSADGVELKTSRTNELDYGINIYGHSTKRLKLGFVVSPKEDVGVLVDHESAIIRATVTVEDNKGAYEVSLEEEMLLTGPGEVAKKWNETME